MISSATIALPSLLADVFLAAGADLTRIHAYKEIVSLPEDVEAITQKVKECRARLIVIDPLIAYLSSKIDSHKDQDVRRALSPLKQMAEETGAAVVIVTHLNKGSAGGPAIYRGGGSIGIIGAARVGLLVGTDPQDAQRRILVSVKYNVGPMPPALSFTLEDDERLHVGRVVWDSVVATTADELLSWRPPSAQQQRSEQAEEWYRERLSDGAWHKSEDVEAERQAAGISTSTAKRARKDGGIVSKRKGFGAGAVRYVGLPGVSGPSFDAVLAAGHKVSADTQNTIESHPPINDNVRLYGENGANPGQDETLCTGGQNPDQHLMDLRQRVADAWELAGLGPTPEQLCRWIGREVGNLPDAIRSGSEVELEELYRYARRGE